MSTHAQASIPNDAALLKRAKEGRPLGRAADPTVAQFRARLAGAMEARQLAKQKAKEQHQAALKQADKEFAELVAIARAAGVSWNDIAAATGISRQVLDSLVKEIL